MHVLSITAIIGPFLDPRTRRYITILSDGPAERAPLTDLIPSSIRGRESGSFSTILSHQGVVRVLPISSRTTDRFTTLQTSVAGRMHWMRTGTPLLHIAAILATGSRGVMELAFSNHNTTGTTAGMMVLPLCLLFHALTRGFPIIALII